MLVSLEQRVQVELLPLGQGWRSLVREWRSLVSATVQPGLVKPELLELRHSLATLELLESRHSLARQELLESLESLVLVRE